MWSGRANRGRPDPKIRRPRGQGRGGVNAGCGFGKNGLQRLQGRGLAGWAFHCGDFGELGAADRHETQAGGCHRACATQMRDADPGHQGQVWACPSSVTLRQLRGRVTMNWTKVSAATPSETFITPVSKSGM